jgi:hypothetical protein
MNQSTTQFRHTLIYGAATGGIISLYLLLLYIFGMMNKTSMTNFGGILFILGGYVSVRQYRNQYKEGFIRFGTAYGTCILTFLAAGFIWAIYEFFLYKYLSPGLLEIKITEAQDALLKLGWNEEKVEAFTTLSKPTPFTNAFGYFFTTAFWGALLSLLIAALLKRESNPLLKQE